MDFGISTGFWIQSLTNIESQINFNQEVINTIPLKNFKKIFGEEYLLFLYCSFRISKYLLSIVSKPGIMLALQTTFYKWGNKVWGSWVAGVRSHSLWALRMAIEPRTAN